MAKLIYSAITSLDGYVADEAGSFNWGEPDTEVFSFINELERPVGTHLYGRRMYETMVSWESDDLLTSGPPVTRDFAEIWRAADKIVYSKTLEEAASRRTRIERDFDPQSVRMLKAGAERDLTIGGARLAGQALKCGLVDEIQLFLVPILVGGGKAALPDGVRIRLELREQRSFASGVAFLRYEVGAAR